MPPGAVSGDSIHGTLPASFTTGCQTMLFAARYERGEQCCHHVLAPTFGDVSGSQVLAEVLGRLRAGRSQVCEYLGELFGPFVAPKNKKP